MKKLLIALFVAVSLMPFVTGCETHLGGGTTNRIEQPTVGQQLIDLQRAKEAGAITDAEFQARKTKLLNSK